VFCWTSKTIWLHGESSISSPRCSLAKKLCVRWFDILLLVTSRGCTVLEKFIFWRPKFLHVWAFSLWKHVIVSKGFDGLSSIKPWRWLFVWICNFCVWDAHTLLWFNTSLCIYICLPSQTLTQGNGWISLAHPSTHDVLDRNFVNLFLVGVLDVYVLISLFQSQVVPPVWWVSPVQDSFAWISKGKSAK
jgi:hypothetical protein